MKQRPPTPPPVKEKPTFNKYLRFSTVGLELGFSVIIGLLVGQWLDKKFGTEPWLLILFLIFGLVAGFRSLFRLHRDTMQQDSTPQDTRDQDKPDAKP